MFRKFNSDSPLDDPENAAHAWARYRRIMRYMFFVTVGVVALAIAALYTQNDAVSIHFYIAVALGVGFSIERRPARADHRWSAWAQSSPALSIVI